MRGKSFTDTIIDVYFKEDLLLEEEQHLGDCGITGEYATPQGYFVDEEEAERFDKQFPTKEKLKLPRQLF